MSPRFLRIAAFADIIGIPLLILWYIWRLQFSARNSWIVFVIWLVASFLLHRDTPRTLGWRADNLGVATKQAAIAYGIMAGALLLFGIARGAPHNLPPNLISLERLWTYFAFCLLQQVALNSLLNNRLMSLIKKPWLSSLLAGIIFAVCHWPNPVLVPLTLVAGVVMAWLFVRNRNIIPLAVGQAILGSIVWWAFPIAWHHHLRIGPGYYLPWNWPPSTPI
jgi:CAAX prenyl protease-like protein